MKQAVEKFLQYLHSVKEFLAAHDLNYGKDLSQFLEYLSAPWGAAASVDGNQHRIIREFVGHLPRQGTGEKLDCAEIGGAAVPVQVLRERRADCGESCASGSNAKIAKSAIPPGSFGGRDEWFLESAGGRWAPE